MTYEQKIIYDTLCEVRDEIYNIVDTLKKSITDKTAFTDTVVKNVQIETVETTALVVGSVAQKHGIKVGFEETE